MKTRTKVNFVPRSRDRVSKSKLKVNKKYIQSIDKYIEYMSKGIFQNIKERKERVKQLSNKHLRVDFGMCVRA